MNKRKRALYEHMWGSEAFDFPVEKTKYRGVRSNNSYTFTNASAFSKDICRDRLVELFAIKRPDLFCEKFKESCGGSGQELKRIATLHSSSLCALLFFYNVSKENPYVMEIEGAKYTFTQSSFEYKNVVIENRNPSNIDVVLLGTDKSRNAVVLFLESKFSEYYESGSKRLKVAAAYRDDLYGKEIYGEQVLAKLGLQATTGVGDSFLLQAQESCYLGGIKQMISHYIGIRKLFRNAPYRNNVVAKAIASGARVLLGEILFTEKIGELPLSTGEPCLDSYKTIYRKLAQVLCGQLKKDGISNFTVLGDVLSYSDLQDKIEPRIKRFYFELGK